MKSLTNDELRNELKANGIEPGPITPATREVYERKLQRIINDGKSGSKDKSASRPSQAGRTEGLKMEGILQWNVLNINGILDSMTLFGF